jgi:hypothetical protein
MLILENIYELIEEASAWKKRARSGTLSSKSASRINRAGLTPSRERYTRGLDTGSDNIINKIGAKSKKGLLAQIKGPISGGRFVFGRQGVVQMPYFTRANKHTGASKKEERELKSINKRHETNELVARERVFKQIGNNKTSKMDYVKDLIKGKRKLRDVISDIDVNSSQSRMLGATGGKFYSHTSKDVINKERDNTNFYQTMYGGSAIDKHNKARKQQFIDAADYNKKSESKQIRNNISKYNDMSSDYEKSKNNYNKSPSKENKKILRRAVSRASVWRKMAIDMKN